MRGARWTDIGQVWKVATQVAPPGASRRRPSRASQRTPSLSDKEPHTMTRKLHRLALASAAVAALGASTLTAAASADTAPAKHSKTMTVCVKSAYIDSPAPGKIFTGTIFKGEHFHVDRTVRVKKGSAKGVWHHGKRIATNSKNGKTYVVTGWVPASAFCA
jgi:hypothetical protein